MSWRFPLSAINKTPLRNGKNSYEQLADVKTVPTMAMPLARTALTDVSQTYSKLLATAWRVSYDGVADNGCFTHDLHDLQIIKYSP